MSDAWYLLLAWAGEWLRLSKHLRREDLGVHRKVDLRIKLVGDAVVGVWLVLFCVKAAWKLTHDLFGYRKGNFSDPSYWCNEKGYCPY